MMDEDIVFKSNIVEEILQKRPEEALKILSKKYDVKPPDLCVGVVKGHSSNVLGVYVKKKRAIYVKDSDILYNPFVLLHEFYHHLRTRPTKHRGTEKYADQFAREFIQAHTIFNKK